MGYVLGDIVTLNADKAGIKFKVQVRNGTNGRVFFTGGNDLDRYVVWDYVTRRRKTIG